MKDPQTIWQAVLGELELMLSKANFTTWFKNTFVVSVDEEKGEVQIGVPNAFTKSWMEQKYTPHILRAVNNICENKIKQLVYEIKTQRQSPQKSVDSISMQGDSFIRVYPLPRVKEIPASLLNPRNTFATFIVGTSNQLAHSASLAVAEEPGTRYNPLFLYGEVGLGKTHLMQAIGHALKEKNPDIKLVYVNFEKFTNDYVAAARKGGFDEFRAFYRGADVILVDDVQFMIDKEKTQDEFFHTFEVLHQQNKQIVITSDRPPKALIELEDRMISRFEWGMIADIKSPDLETRVAILEHKAEEKKFVLDRDLILYIAENITNNIRELEGALNKIIAWYDLNHKEPTLTSVREIVMGFLVDPSRSALTPKRVLEEVAGFYSISLEDLIGACRKRELVLPRQVGMYLMREILDHSYPAIGQNLGGRDHTTVMYACQKIQDMMNAQERLRQDVETIRQRLHA